MTNMVFLSLNVHLYISVPYTVNRFILYSDQSKFSIFVISYKCNFYGIFNILKTWKGTIFFLSPVASKTRYATSDRNTKNELNTWLRGAATRVCERRWHHQPAWTFLLASCASRHGWGTWQRREGRAVKAYLERPIMVEWGHRDICNINLE